MRTYHMQYNRLIRCSVQNSSTNELFRESDLPAQFLSVQLTHMRFSSTVDDPPENVLYSDTLLSKKLVFPSMEIISMKSKGFLDSYVLLYPSASSRRSAITSMYVHMSSDLKPIRLIGNESMCTRSDGSCLIELSKQL